MPPSLVPEARTVRPPNPTATRDLHHAVEPVGAIGRGGADIALDAMRAHLSGSPAGAYLTRRDPRA